MKRSDWIPLSERRPRFGQHVLAFAPPALVSAVIWGDHSQPSRFTHWIKLELPCLPSSLLAKQNRDLLSLLARHD